MEQVFLDNFIKQLKEVADELRNINNAKQSKNAVNEAAPSIISRDDQRDNDNKSKGQGEIVSLDNKSIDNLIKKYNDAFKSDKEKERKEQKDASTKMFDKLDVLTKSSDETAEAQKQQAEQEDINRLTQRDDAKKVYIAGIDKDVIKDLVDVFSNKKADNKQSFDWASLLGGLGLLLGGGLLAFGSDIGSGLSQIGKLAVKLGEKMVKKTLGKITSLISFVFDKGFKALKSMGDTVLKLPETLFNLLPDSIKKGLVEVKDKIFKSLSGVFDMGKDLIKSVPGTDTIKTFLKSLGGVFGNILKNGLKLFKLVPGLGDIINLYFAYEKFTEGDTVGALLELAGAIPGFGIIADFYSLYRDFTYTEKDKAAQNKSLGLTGFFDNIGKKFSGIWEKFIKMPLFKGVYNIIDGIKMVASGSFVDGLKLIGKGILSPAGAVFDAAASVYDWATSLISSGEQEAAAPISTEKFEIKMFNFVGTVKNALASKIEAMKSFTKKIVSKPVEWAKSTWNSIGSYFSTTEETQASNTTEPISTEKVEIKKFDFVGTVTNALAAKIEAMKSFVKKITSKSVEWAKSVWGSVKGYFSTTEETQASNASDAKTAPDLKVNDKTNVAAATQLNNEGLKGLFEALKKTQDSKADAQIRAITITNDILLRIEKTVNSIGFSSSSAQKQSKDMQATDYNVFPLQYTATQVRQQMLAAGYA